MPKPTVAKNLQGKVKVGGTNGDELTHKLSDGNEIPQFGLGVYEMGDQATYDACITALKDGYRHIDTAEWYVISLAPSLLSFIFFRLTSGTRMRRRWAAPCATLCLPRACPDPRSSSRPS